MSPNFLRWFTRGPFGLRLAGRDAAAGGDTLALFDHVDAQDLGVGEFRASGSMHFSGRPEIEFADTVPAWAAPAPPAHGHAALRR